MASRATFTKTVARPSKGSSRHLPPLGEQIDQFALLLLVGDETVLPELLLPS
ncbi:MAG: hypothetical protein K1X57_19690 [Gemmataceae bacterium]|nr:hypothetical protein [Gemmataceae bacterium]